MTSLLNENQMLEYILITSKLVSILNRFMRNSLLEKEDKDTISKSINLLSKAIRGEELLGDNSGSYLIPDSESLEVYWVFVNAFTQSETIQISTETDLHTYLRRNLHSLQSILLEDHELVERETLEETQELFRQITTTLLKDLTALRLPANDNGLSNIFLMV